MVGVPSPLVEHAQAQAAVLREPDQVVGLLGGQGEGLVDDDVPAGLERGPGDVVVLGVLHRDDDQLDGRVVEQGRDRRQHGHAGQVAHLVRFQGGHAPQGEARLGGDQWAVQGRAGHAVADQPDADAVRHHEPP